jgi:hypothetical protein
VVQVVTLQMDKRLSLSIKSQFLRFTIKPPPPPVFSFVFVLRILFLKLVLRCRQKQYSGHIVTHDRNPHSRVSAYRIFTWLLRKNGKATACFAIYTSMLLSGHG